MIAGTKDRLSPRLAAIFRSYPRLKVSLGDEALYRRFRLREPSLVSCLDEQSSRSGAGLHFLVIHCNAEPAGVVSLVIQTNTQKRTARNAFARVVLVIVSETYRKLGLGRVLVISALIHLLEKFGSRLYSISCLAAHPAIEKILEQVGFQRSDRPNRSFVHEELKLADKDIDEVLETMTTSAAAAAQAANFRVRQDLRRL